jgi:hypothetical protein
VKTAPRLTLLLLALSAGSARAQQEDPPEPTIHWAYASFFGTGWYRISEDRDSFIMRAPIRWTFGEAGIDEDGNREIAYTVRLPMTLGLTRFDFDDLGGLLDPENFATASVNASLDADIPITPRFHVRPVAELGYSTVLNQSDRAFTYRAEVKTRTTFEAGELDWALLLDAGIVGYQPNRGSSDDFSFLAAGLEFGYPVSWFSSGEHRTVLYWHVAYTDFLNEIEYQTGIEEFDSVANLWQVGIAIGRRDKPIKIWRLGFDRLGIAFNDSATGDLRGIKFVFRSLYEL